MSHKHYLNYETKIRVTRNQSGELNPNEKWGHETTVGHALRDGDLSTAHGTMDWMAELVEPELIDDLEYPDVCRDDIGVFVMILDDWEINMRNEGISG